MSEWQPMATAPKDGSFLVFRSTKRDGSEGKPYGAGNSNMAVMSRNEKFALIDGYFAWDMPEPELWAELPAPPTGT